MSRKIRYVYRNDEVIRPRGARELLSVPIYLRGEKQYGCEAAAELGRLKAKMRGDWAVWYPEVDFDERFRYMSPGWPVWRFNDIACFLHVWYDGGTRILVDGYVPYRRIMRGLKDKTFEYHYKLSEIRILKWDNPWLKAAVREGIDEAVRRLPKKGLYVDFSDDLLDALNLRLMIGRDQPTRS